MIAQHLIRHWLARLLVGRHWLARLLGRRWLALLPLRLLAQLRFWVVTTPGCPRAPATFTAQAPAENIVERTQQPAPQTHRATQGSSQRR